MVAELCVCACVCLCLQLAAEKGELLRTKNELEATVGGQQGVHKALLLESQCCFAQAWLYMHSLWFAAQF